MSQSDIIGQVAALTAQLKDWQDRAAAATDPSAKAMANMMAGNAETQLQAALTQLQHSVDSTNTFLDNFALQQTLNNVASALPGTLTTVISLFRK